MAGLSPAVVRVSSTEIIGTTPPTLSRVTRWGRPHSPLGFPVTAG